MIDNTIADLVVRDEIVSAHPLDLRGAEHPAHVVNNLNICRRGLTGKNQSIWVRLAAKSVRANLLQLKQFGGLH